MHDLKCKPVCGIYVTCFRTSLLKGWWETEATKRPRMPAKDPKIKAQVNLV